jgi:uncharacterized protein (DUF58 family)
MGNLELVARGAVEGFLIGLHRSPRRGFSVEFAENRPYSLGDDFRFIDWKVLARSDRLFIRQFEAETNLKAHVLLDVSRSMDWTSEPVRFPTKLDYGRLLASTLSLLLIRQGDAAGLRTFDDRLRLHVPARGSEAHWRRLTDALTGIRPGEETDAARALRDLSGHLGGRGLVVLISDLLVDGASTRRALRSLRHEGHELLTFHIMDPGERELPSAGEAIFFDPETGEELATNSAALRQEYRDAVANAIDGWRRESLAMGADYALLTTDNPLGTALGRFLRSRRRRRR